MNLLVVNAEEELGEITRWKKSCPLNSPLIRGAHVAVIFSMSPSEPEEDVGVGEESGSPRKKTPGWKRFSVYIASVIIAPSNTSARALVLVYDSVRFRASGSPKVV